MKGTSCRFEVNVLGHRASVGGDRRANIAPWARVGRRLNEMPQNSYEASQAASGPYVPFDELKSDDAQSRLSRCRPVSGFRPSHVEDNKIMFAHNTGEVNFRRRQPLQLASTLGFVLNQRSGTAAREEFGGGVRVFYRFVRYRPPRVRPAGGSWGWRVVSHLRRKFLGLTPGEERAVHECLTWLSTGAPFKKFLEWLSGTVVIGMSAGLLPGYGSRAIIVSASMARSLKISVAVVRT